MRNVSFFVYQVSFSTNCCHGSHGVEEVSNQKGEDEQSCSDKASSGEATEKINLADGFK